MAEQQETKSFDIFEVAEAMNKPVGQVTLRAAHKNINFNEDTSNFEMTLPDGTEVGIGVGAFAPNLVVNLKNGDKVGRFVVTVEDVLNGALKNFRSQ